MLIGQTAMVTGASRGIGRATAEELARHGASVVLACRDPEGASRAAAELARAHGADTLAVEMDVTDHKQVARGMARTLEWKGRVDIVVNNAGYPVDEQLWNTPLHELPAGELDHLFRKVYDVDLRGARNVTRAALPEMMARESGAFVFVSSTPALAGHKATAYTEAKAGVLGLMRDVALNYGGHGIRANAVALGDIETAWFDTLEPAEQKTLAAQTALGRWGEPREAANAILFFASPLSSFITGQTLVVDGGKVIR